MSDRRAFVAAVMASPWLAARAGASTAAVAATSMYLAYTSFAVRMSQGRDILKSNAAAVGPDALRELCVRFGARGCQIDLSQVPVADLAALDGIRARFEKDAIALEVSIPSRYLETPDAYAQAVAAARALGARCGRVALLSGRRYETFETTSAWTAFTTKWRETLLRMRPEFERQTFAIGIENHKDWLAPDLVALLRAVDSRFVGACVDFGNNIALLEHPDETIAALAPFAVTTHLKDMALKPTADGFELSEVPLGQGILPLDRYVRAIRAARPDAAMCLEMITRDPLRVPFRTDRYWVAFDAAARDTARLQKFEQHILSRASARPLPRITGLAPAAQVDLEDEHVRACVAYARDVLKLETA